MARQLAPMHPGEVLREEFLLPLGLSAGALAKGVRGSAHPHRKDRQRRNRNHGRYRAAAWQGARHVGPALAEPAKRVRHADGEKPDRKSAGEDPAGHLTRRRLKVVLRHLFSSPAPWPPPQVSRPPPPRCRQKPISPVIIRWHRTAGTALISRSVVNRSIAV